MVNIVFHLKSDEGHIERFSFDVYMSPLPIFTKIKHPFAWHISFLVRHLRKYSDLHKCTKKSNKLIQYSLLSMTLVLQLGVTAVNMSINHTFCYIFHRI